MPHELTVALLAFVLSGGGATCAVLLGHMLKERRQKRRNFALWDSWKDSDDA